MWFLKPAAAVSLALFICGWIAQSVQHRRHLSQTVEDLRRFHRLSCRLSGCVSELHHYLTLHPEKSDEVPEPIVGHVVYLHSIRQESADQASRAARHPVRTHWADDYLSRRTPAAKRCELATEQVCLAASAIADACKLYEIRLGEALTSGGPRDDRLVAPIAILDERSAKHLTELRTRFDEAARAIADVTRRDAWSLTMYESKWPIRISELPNSPGEPYGPEIRPMGWTGFGSRPIIHADAR
jgi:hypothetical protein